MRPQSLFERLTDAGFTLNLAKSKFIHSTLTYIGHVVGSGRIKPKDANIDPILICPVSQKSQVMQFLGLSGYYRRFCPYFSTVAAPLIAITSPKRSFVWTHECQQAFEHLKAFLFSTLVLQAPDYNQPFHLYVDASGVGVWGCITTTQRKYRRPSTYALLLRQAQKSHELAYTTTR